MVRPTREMRPRPILSLGMGATYGGGTSAQVEQLMDQVFGYLAHGLLGPDEDFSVLDAGWHSGTLDEDCEFTLQAYAAGEVSSLFLELLQDGTGGWVIDLPASVVNKAELEADQDTTADTTSLLVLLSRDGGVSWFGGWWGQGGSGGSDLTIENEGVPLATFATTLDFVGAGVTASGATADKTITIPGLSATALADAGVVGPLLIADDHSTPIIFGDILLTEAGDDFLYADVGLGV